MKRIYKNCLKISSGKFIIAWAIFYFIYLMAFMTPEKDFETLNGEYQIIDLMMFFTPTKFYATIENYTQSGIDFYLAHVYLDFIYPLIYGFLILLLLVFTLSKIGVKEGRISGLIVLPFLSVFADYGENISFIYILCVWPIRTDTLVYVAMLFNTVKWFSVFISFVVVVVGFYKYVQLKIRENT